MSTPTVPVTVTLAAQDGTPYEGVIVRARLDGNEVYEGIVISDQVEETTDADGVAILNLFPNAPSPTGLGTQGTTYRFFASIPGGRSLNVDARVPNSACRLENILVTEDVGELSAAELAVLQAQAAVTTAASSAAAAEADAAQTAADRVQTGLDRVATGEDRAATAADRVQTGQDRAATGLDAAATAADRVQTGLDRTAAANYATAAALSEAQAAAIVLGNFLQSGTGAVARTFTDKARDIVSVFDFMTTSEIADVKAGTGAVVTTAVQAALNSGAKAVYFPAGTYTANVTTSAAISIYGDGIERTILQASGTGTCITVGADLNLRDMTVKCHTTNASGKTINHTGAYFVRAHRVYFYGVNHSASDGVSAAGLYTHCEFYTTAQPAGLGVLCKSALARFEDCQFLGYRATEVCDSVFYRCQIGDWTFTDTAVHMPAGGKDNSNVATGYTGAAEFYDCRIRAIASGITEGNDAHAILRRCTVRIKGSSAGQGLYARSSSTFDCQDTEITNESATGTGVSFAKTIAQDPNNIGLAGTSIFRRCRIEGGLTSLSVPTLSDTYPASIGNVRLIDTEIIGGDSKISVNTSTYHVWETDKPRYSDNIQFAADGDTVRFRYKGQDMVVGVSGTDAAKTGCHLSHLDRVTGTAMPSGTRITLIYSGVSSRFVTFANGATADSGAMYFAGGATTLATTQQGLFKLELVGTEWRQI